MNTEAIHAMLRQQPFAPFEVRLSNGDVHEVRRPENAVLLKSNLFIGFPERDSFVVCELSHVLNVCGHFNEHDPVSVEGTSCAARNFA